MSPDTDRVRALERAADRPDAATGWERGLILIAVMMALFMAAVEATIVATAMPTIVAELGGFRLFSWVFGAYLLPQAVTTPIYGRLADLYGRKRVFFVGAAIFLAGSALCGFAWGMVPLIAFRALQGLGGGAVRPIATTIVGDLYPPAERARVQGWLSSIWGVSAVAGPLLGAFLVEHVSWSLVFWINLPVGAASVALLAWCLEERPERRRHEMDYLGAGLLVLGTGTLMLAAVQANALGAAPVAALFAAGVAILVALYVHERRIAEPLVPLKLWRDPVIALGNMGAFGVSAILMGVTVFLPPYIQGVMARSPAHAGLGLASMSLSWAFASVAAARVMILASYRAAAVAGAVALGAGTAMLAMLDPARGLAWIAAATCVVGIGMGFCNSTFLISVQSSVERHERGVATSSNIFMWLIGQSLGSALYGAVLNLVLYRGAAGGADSVNRLMEPALRRGLGEADIARLSASVGQGLHDVYLIAVLFASAIFVLTLFLPAGLSPTRPAHEPR